MAKCFHCGELNCESDDNSVPLLRGVARCRARVTARARAAEALLAQLKEVAEHRHKSYKAFAAGELLSLLAGKGLAHD